MSSTPTQIVRSLDETLDDMSPADFSAPKDWQLMPLGALCSFANGVNADKQAYGEGVRFVNVLEVITHSHLHAAHIPGRVRLSKLACEAFEVRRGDLLFNRTSETQEEVGLSAVYDDDERVVFGGFVIRGRFTSYAFNGAYAGYALRAPIVRAQIIARGQGAIRANIGHASLRRVMVPVPPKPEQRAIAEALSDVDGLLVALGALIAKKRAIKQAAMQQLLSGKTRLSGFSGEWETKRLGDIATIAMGRTPSRQNSAFWGRGHVWLSISDLDGKVVDSSSEQITDLAAASMRRVAKGTLLMSFKLSIGRVCFAGCDLFTNEAICSFTDLRANAEYLYYALGRTDFSLYGKQAVKGYTLNSESLRTVEVILPKPDEQSAIATVLSDMDAEIAALEARRDKTRQIKQGMMQQLLTGRVRLVKPEAAA